MGGFVQTSVGAILIALFFTPVLFLLHEARAFPLESMPHLLERYRAPFTTTAVLALTVGLTSLCASAAMVYCLTRLPDRWQRRASWLIALPLIIPPYVGAISYIALFKSAPMLAVFGGSYAVEFVQAAIVLSLLLYPYIALPMYTGCRMIRPEHHNILALHAITPWEKLRILYIPQLKNAVVNGITLIALYVAGDFGAVSLLRIDTVTVELYRDMILKADRPQASVIGLLLLLTAAAVSILSYRFSRNAVESYAPPEKGSLASNSSLKSTTHTRAGAAALLARRNWATAAAVMFVVFMGVLSIGIPVGTVLFWLGQFVLDESSYRAVMTRAAAPLGAVALNSVFTAGSVSAGLTAVAFCYYSWRVLLGLGAGRVVPFAASIAYATPGIITAFSVVVLKFSLAPSASLLFFVYAYLLRFSGLAFASLQPAFNAIPQSMLKLIRVFSSSPVAAVVEVIAPYTSKAVFQSMHFIFYNAVRDLTIPLLLLPVGIELLPMRIWQTANEGLYSYAAPAIGIMLLISIPSALRTVGRVL